MQPGAGNGREGHSIWLNAWTDPVATAPAFTGCMDLVDVDGSGDNHLVVGTQSARPASGPQGPHRSAWRRVGGRARGVGRAASITVPSAAVTETQRLRVYRGGALVNELRLLDTPSAIQSFNPAESTAGAPSVPLLGVAAGPHVFVYRGLRAYFKWVAPPFEIEEQESAVWQQLREDKIDAAQAYTMLSEARDAGCQLSSRAQDVLALDAPERVAELVGQVKERPVAQQTCVTCLTALHRSISEPGSVSSLVVGTENCFVYVLQPVLRGGANNVAARVRLPSPPVFLAAAGSFNVLYRITVACRNNTIYTIKNGEVRFAARAPRHRCCACRPTPGPPRTTRARTGDGQHDQASLPLLRGHAPGKERVGGHGGRRPPLLPHQGQEELLPPAPSPCHRTGADARHGDAQRNAPRGRLDQRRGALPACAGEGGGGGERSQRTVTHPAGPANCRCECTTKSHWWKRPTWVPP